MASSSNGIKQSKIFCSDTPVLNEHIPANKQEPTNKNLDEFNLQEELTAKENII